MPPHNHKKKKKAPKVSSKLDLAELLEDVEDWGLVNEIIRTQLQIPDLSTKAGLKRVYFNFDKIGPRLDATFEKYEDNDQIICGIVGIYTQLCDDSVLRTKLYENDLIPRLLNLLNRDACRQISLHTLTNAGHHGGLSVRADLARNAPILVQTLKDHPDERPTVESIIAILSHSVGSVVNGDYQGPSMPDIHRSLDMKTILKLTVYHMKQPYATRFLIDHGLQLIFAASMHCASVFRSEPDLDMFLVAGLKSKNWGMRGTCLGAIIRSHIMGSPPDVPTPGFLQPAPIERWPSHLGQILKQYGLSRCFLTQQTDISYALMGIITSSHRTRDYYALGVKLADLTLVTEYSLPASPFFPVEEIVPRCVQELRAKGTPADTNRADVLEMKLLIRLQDWHGVKTRGPQIVARNSKSAFVFYTLSLTPDAVGGLRAAKKGLKCTGKDTTPYLYFQLLRRAVELAADYGLCYFQADHEDQGKMKWEEGIAFLMSALEDSETFIDEAPPDNPYMIVMLYWNIILTITMQGPNANLKMVEGALKKLKITEEISSYLELPILPTQTRKAEQMIVRLFDKADKEWGAGIKSMNDRLDDQTPPPDFSEKAKNELAAWLSDMSLDSTFKCSSTVPQVRTEDLWYKRCSWCRNPSVALKKCSGCETARYCDGQCQRDHWSKHKVDCKGKAK
ncbi:hypothetical protein FB446DRAFT_682836 [Lentinula raphanica]|nr:hypothetical protein FB446DRAFT_682836 [Lentinula raphanica]